MRGGKKFMYSIKKHSKYNYVTIVSVPMKNISKIDFALCNQPTETPDNYYKRQSIKPDIMTNGGFFNMSDGVTCFGFMDEGRPSSVSTYSGVGIVRDKELFYGQMTSLPSIMRDFISGYPSLVVGGVKCKINYANEIDYNARRTAFGWNDDTLFIVTVDSPGLRFSPLADIFLELKAKYAINLDGGGSTRMLVAGKRVTSQSYARPVDNVFCIYLNREQPAEKIRYRVQVGAFLTKKYAENLLTELKKLGFSDAYIRKIGLYYKVQVGAFSVKLNAERLADRLRAIGYSPIITTK